MYHQRTDEHVGDAGPVGAGGRRGHLPPDHGEDGGESQQDVERHEQRGQVGAGEGSDRHHQAEARPAQHEVAGSASRPPLHSEELEEEGEGGGRKERPGDDGEPLPQVVTALRAGEPVEELGCREDEEVEGEQREEGEGSWPGGAQESGPGQCQGDDGGEECCLVADVHFRES
jgi:hypothetical protein